VRSVKLNNVLVRAVDWIAQWNEMIADPEQKMGRPRQLFVRNGVRTVLAR
jgi:citrate synthase